MNRGVTMIENSARLNRRSILGGIALGGGLASTASAAAPEEAAAALNPQLLAAMRENAKPLRRTPTGFDGAGWDFLVRSGSQAQFTLLGEQHGLAQIPALAKGLFAALVPAGYEKLVVEVSPQGAAHLDQAARGGLDGVRALYKDHPPGVAFFSQRGEAELAVEARRLSKSERPVLWGLDYEIGSFPMLLQPLVGRAPAKAREAIQAMIAAAEASWRKALETRNPGFYPAFSLDPELVRTIRRAWPKAPSDAAWLLDTLEETLEINRLWMAKDNYGTNLRRNVLNRVNLHRYWRQEKAAGRAPKALFKFGGFHVAPGIGAMGNPDLGNAAYEIATAEGGSSFHVLVGGALEGQLRAQFNPARQSYAPKAESGWWGDMTPYLKAMAYPDAWTVVDLRPLRRVIYGLEPDAGLPVSTIRQMDALVLIPDATPQENL